ncbi:type 1 glutamine amidotransferase [Ilumatobacter sp.]|uniref:type 1 glutamine amidotransferase n=1 Tax=Ilumatobacter sp. TaxID=1967498 RepID=UPI003C6804C2
MRALVLAHEPDGPAAQVERRLVERGFTVDTHVVTSDNDRPDEAAPFPSLDGYDLLVPMGSIRSLTNKDEIGSWIHTEIELVAAAHEADVPVLGVCFGIQIIAEALGGAVEPAPVTELGWIEISDGDVPNPVGSGPWLEWHHDRIVTPPGAEVLARTDHAVQLIRLGRTVGTQFHPEVDLPHIQRFLELTEDSYLEEYGTTREELLAATRRNEAHNIEQCHALVDWYLDTVAFPALEVAG